MCINSLLSKQFLCDIGNDKELCALSNSLSSAIDSKGENVLFQSCKFDVDKYSNFDFIVDHVIFSDNKSDFNLRCFVKRLSKNYEFEDSLIEMRFTRRRKTIERSRFNLTPSD